MALKLGLILLLSIATATSSVLSDTQHPLVDDSDAEVKVSQHGKDHSRLHGRFLQITGLLSERNMMYLRSY